MNLTHPHNSTRSLAGWARLQIGLPGFAPFNNPQGKPNVEQRVGDTFYLPKYCCFVLLFFSEQLNSHREGVLLGWQGGRGGAGGTARVAGDQILLLDFTPCQRAGPPVRSTETQKESTRAASATKPGRDGLVSLWLRQTHSREDDQAHRPEYAN